MQLSAKWGEAQGRLGAAMAIVTYGTPVLLVLAIFGFLFSMLYKALSVLVEIFVFLWFLYDCGNTIVERRSADYRRRLATAILFQIGHHGINFISFIPPFAKRLLHFPLLAILSVAGEKILDRVLRMILAADTWHGIRRGISTGVQRVRSRRTTESNDDSIDDSFDEQDVIASIEATSDLGGDSEGGSGPGGKRADPVLIESSSPSPEPRELDDEPVSTKKKKGKLSPKKEKSNGERKVTNTFNRPGTSNGAAGSARPKKNTNDDDDGSPDEDFIDVATPTKDTGNVRKRR